MDADALFKLATGRAPDGNVDARWPPFREACETIDKQIQAALIDARARAFTEAKVAVGCYQPIDIDGMTPQYRRCFDETRRGCEAAVAAFEERQRSGTRR